MKAQGVLMIVEDTLMHIRLCNHAFIHKSLQVYMGLSRCI
jgi:hypothetical protein